MSSDAHRQRVEGRAATASRPRPGFTLTELIVALVLLTVGLLALASTSTFLGYEHAAAARAESAAIIAGSRMERLRAGGCTAGNGLELVDGLQSAWSVAVAGDVAVATVVVSWLERGTRTDQRYSTGFPC